MLRRARDLMRIWFESRKITPEKKAFAELVTIQEKVMILCLMVYCLHPEKRVRNYINQFMEQNWVRLNKRNRESHEAFARTESEWQGTKTTVYERMCFLLTGDFHTTLRSRINPAVTEVEIEAIALKIYEEYFC
jgi:hypothetical protein